VITITGIKSCAAAQGKQGKRLWSGPKYTNGTINVRQNETF